MEPNWPSKKIGEVVVEIIGGGTPKRSKPEYWEGNIPWMTIEDINDNFYILKTRQLISKKGLENSNAKLIPPESVILSCTASVGNIAINKIPLTTNQQFNSFVCNKEIIPEFLAYTLILKKKIIKQLGGITTFSFISKSRIVNLKIPLPPLKIQKQIVERMDKIAEAQKLNDELIQKADELFQSLLCQELNPVGKNWGVKKLGDNDIIEIVDGDRGKNYPPKNEFKKSGFCLFLNTKNVTQEGFVFNEVDFISKERDEKLRKGKLQRNDVILTTRGTVGNSALYSDSIEFNHIRINSGMVILRPNAKKIIPKFLWLVVGGGMTQSQFKRILSGTAQPQLPIVNLVKTKFPLPPLQIQKQIVAKLSAAQEYKKQLLEQKLKLKEFFDSVLHRSMNFQG